MILFKLHIVDIWTFLHIALWLVIGAVLCGLKARLPTALLAGLIVGIAWELVELGLVEPVLRFHEPPLNRWVSDPLSDLIGTFGGWVIWKRHVCE